MIGIIGKKLGMTQIFNEQGQQIPCTVIEAAPNPVLAVTTRTTHGFASVQLGFGTQRLRARVQAGRAHAARPSREQGRDRSRDEGGTDCAAATLLAVVPSRRRAGKNPEIPTFNVGDKIDLSIFAPAIP